MNFIHKADPVVLLGSLNGSKDAGLAISDFQNVGFRNVGLVKLLGGVTRWKLGGFLDIVKFGEDVKGAWESTSHAGLNLAPLIGCAEADCSQGAKFQGDVR